jgi:phospholipase A1
LQGASLKHANLILPAILSALLFLQPTVGHGQPLVDEAQKIKQENQDGLNFFRHRDNYFISGKDETKIQLSFKMQILSDSDYYLGYTQVMFWDIGNGTSHFSDVNYNPEFFYRLHTNYGILKGVDLSPLEHKSDGQTGINMRAWNRAFVSFHTEFELFHAEAHWDSKVFRIYDSDQTNADINNKLGLIETSLSIHNIFQGIFNEDQITLSIVPGGTLSLQENQGSQQLDFKFRLKVNKLNPFILLQVFNGYNEALLRYNSPVTSYRIGLSL